jgi:purine-binding chemotaxis protein CheW
MSETYVLFELAGTTYGLRTRDVQHMEMVEQITPVPNTSPAVEGVVFSRGQVVPAVNLRVRFGFPREPHTMRTRLIIVQAHQRVVGLIVDAAREFSAIPDEAIRPIQQAVTGMESNYLIGIATLNQRLVLLLDLETTLNLDQVISVPSMADLSARMKDLADKNTDPQRAARG